MSESLTQISVTGHSDIELFVVNHSLQLVARGTLPWNGNLPSGVYKFKFRRGNAIEEQTVILEPGSAPRSLAAPALATASPVPLAASSRTHEYHMAAAIEHSLKIDQTFGKGGQLFLLVRDWTTRDRPGRTSNPAAGLRICDAAGVVLIDVEKTTGGEGDQDRWAVVNIELNPGSYRLRLETIARGAFEQTVVVSNEWQTQVFMLLSNYGSAEEPDWRADISRASVLMAKVGEGFEPQSEAFRLADTACAWLGSRQQTAAAAGLRRALDLKYDNPMLGIYAAHAVASGRTKDKIARQELFDESFFAAVVSHLENLVPAHPDVQALRLWLEDASSMTIPPLHMPPMLTSSWMKFVEASASRRELIARGSLASKIGGCVWGDGPWLIWSADDVERLNAPEKDVEDVDILNVLNRLQDSGLDSLDLNNLESALMQQVGAAATTPRAMTRSSPARRMRVKSAEELVKNLGVPLETLQAAAIDLLEKSSRKK